MGKAVKVGLIYIAEEDSINGGLGVFIKHLSKELSGDANIELYTFELRQNLLGGYSFKNKRQVKQLVDKLDLIHINDALAFGEAKKLFGRTPIALTVHMLHHKYTYNESLVTSARIKDIETEAINGADKVFAVSSFLRDEILNLTGRESQVICNGCDLISLHPRNADENKSEINIGLISRLVRQKGMELLPRVVANAVSEKHRIRFHVYGTGPLESWLKNKIRKQGHENRVEFHGWANHSEISSIYENLDASLSLTRYEPFGISYLESVALGVPVIGSVVGGMHEYCTPFNSMHIDDDVLSRKSLADAATICISDTFKGNWKAPSYSNWREVAGHYTSSYMAIAGMRQ